jgi:NTP pyrophosphatase (non-canonical NTP hydrolase)
MTFNDYQAAAHSTAQYPQEQALYYLGLGLTGEAGEVAEKLKKLLRNNGGEVTPEFVTEIKKELGDVLWYIAELATTLGLTLDDVAETNVAKLRDRAERGVLKSTGDNR